MADEAAAGHDRREGLSQTAVLRIPCNITLSRHSYYTIDRKISFMVVPPLAAQYGSNDAVTSWVAIDFETANSSHASVCQVGMASVTNGRIDDTFDSLIKPMSGFDDFYGINTSTHGLTFADVADAPSWPQVWEHMLKFIDRRPIVAHSAASAEVSMIKQTCALWSVPVTPLRYACSRQIGKKVWNVEALKKCAQQAHVPLVNHHDALDDATACAHIVLAAMHEARVDDLHGLNARLGLSWNRLAPYTDAVKPPSPESAYSRARRNV
jgi:DNA polymerase-3 subunit epsilon